jgi:hypothetical protein
MMDCTLKIVVGYNGSYGIAEVTGTIEPLGSIMAGDWQRGYRHAEPHGNDSMAGLVNG